VYLFPDEGRDMSLVSEVTIDAILADVELSESHFIALVNGFLHVVSSPTSVQNPSGSLMLRA